MARTMNPFTNKLEKAGGSSPAASGSGSPTSIPTKVGEEYLDTDTGTWYKSIDTTSVDDRVAL